MKSKILRKRIFAFLLDYLIYFTFCLFYLIYFGDKNNEDAYSVSGFKAMPIFIFWLIYFVVTESILKATLGHYLLNLKVIQIDHKEIDIKNSFKRHILDFVDFSFFGLPAFINIKNSEKGQRIGDLFARTTIIESKK